MQRGTARCYYGWVITTSAPSPAGLRGFWSRLAWVMRRVIGAPDYESYVAHVRRVHPGEEPASEQEFIRRHMDSKVKPGSRCC
jgi:uncharacterized short protein YbdD (DUF466 family)